MNSVVRAMSIMYVRCESDLGHKCLPLTCGYLFTGPRPGREEDCTFSMARPPPTRTSFPMGNYVIRAGNYVSTSRSTMGNYVSADTSC
jgi:hypothetical protein